MAMNKATMKTNIIDGIVANVAGADNSTGVITDLVGEIVDGIIDELISNGQATIPITTVSVGVSPTVVLNPAPITTLTLS